MMVDWQEKLLWVLDMKKRVILHDAGVEQHQA